MLRLKAIALLLITIGFSLVLMGCQTAAMRQGQWVNVSNVVSGQTIEVLDPTGKTALNQRVRLLGIDAPDLKQDPWGLQSRDRLMELIGGQSVWLEPDVEARDEYDRLLGYLWKDGTLVNEQLVAEGWALAVGRSPNLKYEQRLLYAQEKARLLGLGLWSPDQPMRVAPAEFRQQNL